MNRTPHCLACRRTRAFTLVELAIVIVIAAILTAIAIPIYTGMVEEAKWSGPIQILGVLARAMDMHKTRYGSFDAAAESGFAPVQGMQITGALDGLGLDLQTHTQLAAIDGYQGTRLIELEPDKYLWRMRIGEVGERRNMFINHNHTLFGPLKAGAPPAGWDED